MLTFLFDMDGTLLDSSSAIVDAVADGLTNARKIMQLPAITPDRELIINSLGLPNDEYFRTAYPQDSVPEELRAEFALMYAAESEKCEVETIAAGNTELYPDVYATLVELKKRDHTLKLFTNSNTAYCDAVVKAHRLDELLTEHLPLERARELGVADTKTEMVKLLCPDLANTVVVGDRNGDIEAGINCGTRTVGCSYGFGLPKEVQAADYTINSLSDILGIEF